MKARRVFKRLQNDFEDPQHLELELEIVVLPQTRRFLRRINPKIGPALCRFLALLDLTGGVLSFSSVMAPFARFFQGPGREAGSRWIPGPGVRCDPNARPGGGSELSLALSPGLVNT